MKAHPIPPDESDGFEAQDLEAQDLEAQDLEVQDLDDDERDVWSAVWRGWRGRCPNCGRGSLFRAFLKVCDACPVCHEELHHQRADDAPSYFVILIVGHIVVFMVLAVETEFAPPYWVHLALWIPITLGLSLALLQPIKGVIVGLQWAWRMHGFDPGQSDPRPGRQPVARAPPMNEPTGERIDRMNDFARRMNDFERDPRYAGLRPKDAATLILIDRSGPVPKVLLGKRHARHKFMPGKFVFPGGGVDPSDKHMPVARPLDPHAQARLLARFHKGSPVRARALALAAIRETCEETGLLLGARRNGAKVPDGPWAAFAQHQVLPDLAEIHFIGRAITPPGRPRRFDARFFSMDAGAVAHRIDGITGPDAELTELVWMPLAEAKELDMPAVTGVMLDELDARIAQGLSHDLPVPFYRMLRGGFLRELL